MDGTLYTWAADAANALDIPEDTRWVADRDVVHQVLDLAKEVAMGSVRPAAPVGAFLAGVAVGLEHADGPEALERIRERLATTLDPQNAG